MLCFARSISQEDILTDIKSRMDNIYVTQISTSVFEAIASVGILISLRCVARIIMGRIENLIESNMMLLPPQTIGVPLERALENFLQPDPQDEIV